MLLIQHKGLGKKGILWTPPGGEVQFNESMEKALQREFYEETGLLVRVDDFLFISEYISAPLHAVEIYYSVELKGGILTKGIEPEIGGANIITDLKYFSEKDIIKTDREVLHRMFSDFKNFDSIKNIKGVLK